MANPDRAKSLIAQAWPLPKEERRAFLEEACQGDQELWQQVESGLRALAEDITTQAEAGQDLPTRTMAAGTTPSGAPDPYQLAGTFIDHYEIQERLGKGGMGVVYKAHDTRLHRTVALKFLSLALSDETAARERFFAEARSASALDHNNICTVHEIGETDDNRIYIVMAHYEGQTLRQRLAAGRLSLETTLDYAAQIATGLAAAHDKGILHRDMKPANVMLTAPAPGAEQGIVKILDFGLAKIEGHDLTRTGTTMGTVAYMSPEQAIGERVDQRADIWSLGVMLYEMLTGQRPFQGKTEAVVLNAVMNEEPRPPREVDPEIPEALEALVLRCLEKDPERRCASVDELLVGLRGFLQATVSFELSGTLAAPPVVIAAPGWRRMAMAAGIAVLVVVGLALAVPWTRQALLRGGAPAAAPPERLVAVLPFINSLAASPENEALVDGLTHSVTSMIARLGSVHGSVSAVPANEIFQRRVTTSADARKYFGVDTVVTGSVQQITSTTEMILSLIDPSQQPPRTLDSRTLAAPLDAAQRERVLAELADLLGLEAPAGSSQVAAAETPDSAAAYTPYLQGVGYLQRYEKPGNLEAAIEVLGRAIEEAPDYGPSYAALCEALWQQFHKTDTKELSSRAIATCNRASELARDQPGVLVTVGRGYLEVGEYRRARAELERALEIEPRNAEAHRWLAWSAFLEGRQEESAASFRQAIELQPRLWVYPYDFGETLVEAGRYEEAIEQFVKSRSLTPENYLVHNALGVARNELNQVAAAREHFQRSLDLQANPMAARNLGYLEFRERQYDRAVEELERARDLLDESPSFNDWIVWSWLGHAYYWAGDRPEAEQAWRRLIEIATPLYEVNPKNLEVLMLLSDAHAALGDLERARFYQGRLLALPIDAVHVRYYIGRTYEMMGDRELAISYIQRALEERFDPLTVERDPWLEGLRTDPRYQALRQQYLPSVE